MDLFIIIKSGICLKLFYDRTKIFIVRLIGVIQQFYELYHELW